MDLFLFAREGTIAFCDSPMNSNKLQNLLIFNRNMLTQALPSFQRSIEKCRAIDLCQPISFESEESLDALSSKYARVSDIHTQKVIKTLLLLVREEAPTFLESHAPL